MTDITDLITRLEGATEGSRELDCLVALAVGHPDLPADCRVETLLGECVHGGYDNNADYLDIPGYSTSVDAALTLIPKGYDASIEIYGNGEADAVILAATGNERGVGWIKAPTVPLAIVIAALKSRSRQSGV